MGADVIEITIKFFALLFVFIIGDKFMSYGGRYGGGQLPFYGKEGKIYDKSYGWIKFPRTLFVLMLSLFSSLAINIDNIFIYTGAVISFIFWIVFSVFDIVRSYRRAKGRG